MNFALKQAYNFSTELYPKEWSAYSKQGYDYCFLTPKRYFTHYALQTLQGFCFKQQTFFFSFFLFLFVWCHIWKQLVNEILAVKVK